MNNENVMDKTLDDLDELYHYGVPGMKWGVRRSPAQLGHKTGSKKRRTKAKQYVENLMKQHKAKKEAKKAAEEERKKEEAERNKPISKMTDAELAKYITRKTNEKTALGLERDIKGLQPEKISAGKKFMNNFADKAGAALADSVSNMAKNLVSNAIDKALGQGAYDPLNKLKKEAEAAGYKKKISEAVQEAVKAERDKYNLERQRKGDQEKDAAEAAKADEAARKANEERSRQEYERSSNTYSYTPNPTKSKYSTGSSTDKVYVGELVEDGGSRRSAGQSYVSGYLSTPASSTSNSTRQLGQSYIAGLLPAPKDDD